MFLKCPPRCPARPKVRGTEAGAHHPRVGQRSGPPTGSLAEPLAEFSVTCGQLPPWKRQTRVSSLQMCRPKKVSWELGGQFHLRLHPSSISPSLMAPVNRKPESLVPRSTQVERPAGPGCYGSPRLNEEGTGFERVTARLPSLPLLGFGAGDTCWLGEEERRFRPHGIGTGGSCPRRRGPRGRSPNGD